MPHFASRTVVTPKGVPPPMPFLWVATSSVRLLACVKRQPNPRCPKLRQSDTITAETLTLLRRSTAGGSASGLFGCTDHRNLSPEDICASSLIGRNYAATAVSIFVKDAPTNMDPYEFKRAKIVAVVDDIGVEQIHAIARASRLRQYDTDYARATVDSYAARQFVVNYADMDPKNRIPSVKANIAALVKKEQDNSPFAQEARQRAKIIAEEYRTGRIIEMPQEFQNTPTIVHGGRAAQSDSGESMSNSSSGGAEPVRTPTYYDSNGSSTVFEFNNKGEPNDVEWH
ncbi:hypothetical protein EVC45_38525 [Paraburkholderia sp. UYCP14C]|uniref:hypothetical protein n=1 Tax=Paraburkholderia sp. UYCP14C TaxID=2511130 RepID=UPI00101F681C|nr:hypothetical protein [Paraburkholderia sp. UYCP14C]RZF24509.1 hypothetical protein EVC45_38525 [Paraburkholderia sp. UYCP14C]